MPKRGVESARRKSLIDAAIAEIGRTGSLDVTVSQIAKRAGVSSALAHHYFGSKDQIFLAAMGRLLRDYGDEVRQEAERAEGPRARAEAIVRASFSERNFQREAVAAWLSFYVRAQTSDAAALLLKVYHRRLHANLAHSLRPLVGDSAPQLAQSLGALIDGLYIRGALQSPPPSRQECVRIALDHLDLHLPKKDI